MDFHILKIHNFSTSKNHFFLSSEFLRFFSCFCSATNHSLFKIPLNSFLSAFSSLSITPVRNPRCFTARPLVYLTHSLCISHCLCKENDTSVGPLNDLDVLLRFLSCSVRLQKIVAFNMEFYRSNNQLYFQFMMFCVTVKSSLQKTFV